jgi:hypothetical protein
MAMAMAFTSCAKFQYDGDEYLRTDHLEVINEFSDIPEDQPYRIMGVLSVVAGTFDSENRLKKKLINEAKKKGADALIIEQTGEERRSVNAKNANSTPSVTGPSNMKMEYGRMTIKAILIKFE